MKSTNSKCERATMSWKNTKKSKKRRTEKKGLLATGELS
jgi:hypothetical protein